jgi:colicin import membrane protein
MATAKRAQRRADLPDPLAPATAKPTTVEPVQGDLTVLPPGEANKNQLARVYAAIEQGLKVMREKHGHVLTAPPVVTAENIDTVKASLKEMVAFRTTLESTRKREKEESLQYGRLVDAEAKRIQAEADPIEKAYKDAVQKWENAEAERQKALLGRIAGLRRIGSESAGLPLEQLRERLKTINAFPVEEMQEYREQAAQAQLQSSQQVKGLIAQAEEAEEAKARAAAAEAEAARVKVHQERIAAIRTAAAAAREARTSKTIALALKVFVKLDPDLQGVEAWQEFFAEAARVYDEELRGLHALLAERQRAEAVEAENQAMREKLAAFEREQAQRQHDAMREEQQRRQEEQEKAEPRKLHIIEPGPFIDDGGAAILAAGSVTRHAADDGAEVVAPQDQPDGITADGNAIDYKANPEARERLPQEGGLFRAESIGQDSDGNMVAQLVPASADEAGAMRVTPDPDGGPGVMVEGMGIQTDVGFMPPPPDADEVILHLAEHYDDHPMNIVTLLRDFDYAALAVKYA